VSAMKEHEVRLDSTQASIDECAVFTMIDIDIAIAIISNIV